MGKLGKKARKFAKKGLQTQLKRQRKLKSFFKKRDSKKNKLDDAEVLEEDTVELSNGRETEDGESHSLDVIFSEDDSDLDGEDSDSDGFIPEDQDFSVTYNDEIGSEDGLEDNNGSALSVQNKEIQRELAENLKKIDTLKEKDPKFQEYLEFNYKVQEPQRREDIYSDEDETSDDDGEQILNANSSNSYEGKFLTTSAVASWCQLVKEQQNVSAFTCLLNGYRAACHCGNEATGILADNSCPRFQSSETYCEVLMFTLSEADNIFKQLLGINSSKCRKDMILELKNTTRWKNLRPLVKLYLRSTLFLLNQASDSEILAYALTRIRPSIAFFAVFPSLLKRLVKIAIYLWATGKGTLSLYSFHVIQDVTSVFSSNCFNTCFGKMYKAFMDNCKSMEPAHLKHIQFLRDSIVELCSLDVQQSSNKAVVSIQLLGKILQQGIRTKEKEAVKKICSEQYINCIDLWVAFISANISEYDLQTLLVTITKIINGVAQLFPGPRYLPLRLKCIGWLNNLSGASGVFIPIISLVLNILEYKIGKVGGKNGKAFNLSCAVKLPKYWLKSRKFNEECVLSAIELLSVHFSQWSYHVSFPDLATVPLIHMRKFHEITSVESFRRAVKRFIDQVEQNVEFIKKKRDEAAFSPKDLQSIETFLQLEKCGGNVPFMQYYKSIIERAATRNLIKQEKPSSSGQKKSKRKREVPSDNKVNGVVPNEEYPKKRSKSIC